MEIVEKAVGEPIDPAVEFESLPLFPSVLHEAGFLYVARLIQDIEFAKKVFLLGLA
jgi:hypothetical protein